MTLMLIQVKLFIVVFFCGILSCSEYKVTDFKTSIDSKDRGEKLPSHTNQIQLVNSVWVIGEIGLNGEQPDTMRFISKDSLLYISTDAGPQFNRYSLKGDTIIWEEFQYKLPDITSIEDVRCRIVNRMLYEKLTIKYLESYEYCFEDKEPKHLDMDSLGIRFRRL